MVEMLGMFEFVSWEEATLTAAKAPSKWIDGVKKDDDLRDLVSCRLVARDFKRRREGRLVRGVATAGGKDIIVCMRYRGAREETSTGPGRSGTHVRRREESAPQREM